MSEDTLSRSILHNFTARDTSSGKYTNSWVIHAGKYERMKDLSNLFQNIVVASMAAGVKRVAFVTVLSSRLWEIAARSVSNTLTHIYLSSFHVCSALSPSQLQPMQLLTMFSSLPPPPSNKDIMKHLRLQEQGYIWDPSIRQQTLITQTLHYYLSHQSLVSIYFGLYKSTTFHQHAPTHLHIDRFYPWRDSD